MAFAVTLVIVFAITIITDSSDIAGKYDMVMKYGMVIMSAVLGIGSWHRAMVKPKQPWQKIFAILALPWFCTAPIVLSFAWVGIAALVTPLTFLPLPPWQSAWLLELLLVGGSSWLWQWGQRREAMARNPLQGGLIEKTLRAQYGRPRR